MLDPIPQNDEKPQCAFYDHEINHNVPYQIRRSTGRIQASSNYSNYFLAQLVTINQSKFSISNNILCFAKVLFLMLPNCKLCVVI